MLRKKLQALRSIAVKHVRRAGLANKARLADSRATQINLMARADVHASLKEIAKRTRNGEDLAAVLVSLVQGLSGKRLEKLEMRGEAMANRLLELPPPPSGKVNIAVACADKASGGVRKKLKSLVLTYMDRVFAGPIDPQIEDEPRRPVEATGGALVIASCLSEVV